MNYFETLILVDALKNRPTFQEILDAASNAKDTISSAIKGTKLEKAGYSA